MGSVRDGATDDLSYFLTWCENRTRDFLTFSHPKLRIPLLGTEFKHLFYCPLGHARYSAARASRVKNDFRVCSAGRMRGPQDTIPFHPTVCGSTDQPIQCAAATSRLVAHRNTFSLCLPAARRIMGVLCMHIPSLRRLRPSN